MYPHLTLPLLPRTRIGPYEISAPLGSGGMGEVYRATDTRLGREVAIKVLPAHMASHPDLKTRFHREAKAISLLNHPHICTLFDVGEWNESGEDHPYLVMELIEGDSLAQRLDRGPLPLDQALRYGMQIADALDRAHRRGIVHRDLKPGNIMITKGGVKLLDFGLAKFGAPGDLVATSDATTMNPATAEGVVVGTLQYMPPEQLEGREVDARTDIFSFGAVLYEMVTGQRAFQASSQASLIAAILHDQPPPVSQIQPVTPKALDRVIATCLAKDPEERWQNVRDVMLELRGIAESPAVAEEATRVRRRPWVTIAAVLALGLLALAFWLGRKLASPAIGGGSRLEVSVDLATPMSITPNGFGSTFAISPDGSKIVWVGGSGGKEALYVRSLDSSESRRIEGSEGAHSVFFSPDGQSIGFFSMGKMQVTSLGSGASTVIGEGPGPSGVWLPDGTIVFNPFPGAPLQRIPVSGGAHPEITKIETAKGESGHSWPSALPDGKTILYTVEVEGKGWDDARIVAQSLVTGEKKTVLQGGSNAVYVEPGFLLYYRAGNVLAVPFDPDKVVVSGEPIVVVTNVIQIVGTGAAFFRASRNGTLLYYSGGADFFATRLDVMSRDGKTRSLPLPPRTYMNPRLSHDGRQLAIQVGGSNDDIWVYQRDRETMTRLTSTAENLFPVWSPDDKRLAVSTIGSNGLPTINLVRTDGSEKPVALTQSDRGTFATSWSSNDVIAFQEFGGSTSFDIYTIRSDGTDKRTFLRTPFNEGEAMFSPDGRWIAYSSNESGVLEVYVRAKDGSGEKIQVSTSGGREPVWRRDGRLFYKNGNSIMAVDVVAEATTLNLSKPQPILEGPFSTTDVSPNYDVNRDATEFFVITRDPELAIGRSLQLIMNPFAKQR